MEKDLPPRPYKKSKEAFQEFQEKEWEREEKEKDVELRKIDY